MTYTKEEKQALTQVLANDNVMRILNDSMCISTMLKLCENIHNDTVRNELFNLIEPVRKKHF